MLYIIHRHHQYLHIPLLDQLGFNLDHQVVNKYDLSNTPAQV